MLNTISDFLKIYEMALRIAGSDASTQTRHSMILSPSISGKLQELAGELNIPLSWDSIQIEDDYDRMQEIDGFFEEAEVVANELKKIKEALRNG